MNLFMYIMAALLPIFTNYLFVLARVHSVYKTPGGRYAEPHVALYLTDAMAKYDITITLSNSVAHNYVNKNYAYYKRNADFIAIPSCIYTELVMQVNI